MGEKIQLTQARRTVTRAAFKDSIVTCEETSAPDVYVHANGKETVTLRKGDSTPFLRLTKMTLYLFCEESTSPYSATIDISEVPDLPKQNLAEILADYTVSVAPIKKPVSPRQKTDRTKTSATKNRKPK